MTRPSQGPYECPVEFLLDVLGGKWRSVILAHLKQGPRRYGELRRLIPKLSEKMLTQRLRELEAHGLVERLPDGAHAPYRLTARADRLRPVLQALYDMGERLAEETGVRIVRAAEDAAGAAP
jgi:DNA-binding HxlR family transcriptional regulator